MGSRAARQVRPRYGRIAVAATSTSVTAFAVLGGIGILPSAAEAPERKTTVETVADARPLPDAAEPRAEAGSLPTSRHSSQTRSAEPALPDGSGKGRRVVFSEGEQRVWLVRANGEVLRTYLVSGSVYDNLDPGVYSVYSRSEQAWGIDDSGTMKYFVRFAQGDNAAIGFHDIPVDDGVPVQTVDDLGTPLSHGCIRQRRADAKELWDFAPVGTKVVVTA